MDQLSDNTSLGMPTQTTIKHNRKHVKFIARGGFSEIYKAIWIDGPVINKWIKKNQSFYKPEYNKNYEVVLKKLNNSKEITSKALNEVITIIY
ncbi:16551_t:CDS:2 [Rhizophagus irregularis]|nr:16551_t:CDS:2 [Rhizophagus irregularis]